MSEVPKHLQSYTSHDPRSQKQILKEYKASLTPEKKAEIKKNKAKEKALDKRQSEGIKKSKAATKRRAKDNSTMKTLTFPGYRK